MKQQKKQFKLIFHVWNILGWLKSDKEIMISKYVKKLKKIILSLNWNILKPFVRLMDAYDVRCLYGYRDQLTKSRRAIVCRLVIIHKQTNTFKIIPLNYYLLLVTSPDLSIRYVKEDEWMNLIKKHLKGNTKGLVRYVLYRKL